MRKQVLCSFDPRTPLPSAVVLSCCVWLVALGWPLASAVVPTQDAFEQADSDGSGQLDSDEVAGFLAAQGVEMPSGFVEELMRTHDTDGSGKIDLPEFQRLMERAQNWLNPLGVKK